MPTPPVPGFPGMTDTLEFVKNLWGSMNVPGINMSGMAAPAFSTDDLDKKIADLKAVEAWLNLNATMLRGTIQALEVQRGTIAALKTMSASMAQAMRPPGGNDQAASAAGPFNPFFSPPGAAGGTAAAAPAGGTRQQTGAASQPEQAGAAAMPAAVAWWNLLQDQFQQAVTSAMSPEAMAGATAMAQDAAARFGAAGQPGTGGSGTDTTPAAPPDDSVAKAARNRAARQKNDKS
jgi:hypothetical protein